MTQHRPSSATLRVAPRVVPGNPPAPGSAASLAALSAVEARALRDAVDLHRSVLVERLAAGEDGTALGRANARFLTTCILARFAAASRITGYPDAPRPGLALSRPPAASAGERSRSAARCGRRRRRRFDQRRCARRHRVRRGAPLSALGRDADGRAPGPQRGRLRAPRAGRSGHRHRAARSTPARRRRDTPSRSRGARGTKASSANSTSPRSSIASTPEASSRHERFGGSLYLLEPDVKNGAGGLQGSRRRSVGGARPHYRITHGDADTRSSAPGASS